MDTLYDLTQSKYHLRFLNTLREVMCREVENNTNNTPPGRRHLRSRCSNVKIYISLYLLNMLMDHVDTLLVGRYWSEVICCTITTHLGDLEVKVTDLEILC